MELLLVILAVVLIFELAAVYWGADSRDLLHPGNLTSRELD